LPSSRPCSAFSPFLAAPAHSSLVVVVVAPPLFLENRSQSDDFIFLFPWWWRQSLPFHLVDVATSFFFFLIDLELFPGASLVSASFFFPPFQSKKKSFFFRFMSLFSFPPYLWPRIVASSPFRLFPLVGGDARLFPFHFDFSPVMSIFPFPPNDLYTELSFFSPHSSQVI